MACGLPEIPIELLEQIYVLLSDKSLIELRKVSKHTKALADVVLLNRLSNPIFERLTIIKEDEGGAIIKFSFDQDIPYNRYRSKRFIVSAMNYLNYELFMHSEGLVATVTPSETQTLFDGLTHLMSEAEFRVLKISTRNFTTAEITSTVAKLLDGKATPKFFCELDNADYSREVLLLLIDRLGVNVIWLELVNIVPSTEFLQSLAGKLDAIFIYASNTLWTGDSELLAKRSREESGYQAQLFKNTNLKSIITTILKCRCSYLDISRAHIDMSVCQARQLSSELYHHLDRGEFYFAARTTMKKFRHSMTWFDQIIQVRENMDISGMNLLEVRHTRRKRREW